MQGNQRVLFLRRADNVWTNNFFLINRGFRFFLLEFVLLDTSSSLFVNVGFVKHQFSILIRDCRFYRMVSVTRQVYA